MHIKGLRGRGHRLLTLTLSDASCVVRAVHAPVWFLICPPLGNRYRRLGWLAPPPGCNVVAREFVVSGQGTNGDLQYFRSHRVRYDLDRVYRRDGLASRGRAPA